VMVALAIMAMAVIVLIQITTNNVRAAVNARLVTTATFLARAKMALIEDQILIEGFVDTEQEDQGTFSDEGYPQFQWFSLIERVELPADAALQAQQAATQSNVEATTGPASASPLAAMSGILGGFMSTLIEPIKNGLQESVRRVTLRVVWIEAGRGEQSFEIVTYMTDPAKLELAMPTLPGGAGGAGGGTGGTGGTGGSRGGSTGAGGTGGSSVRSPTGPRGRPN
jgi:hypothetical protein